jgi:hypothetical protein
MNGDGPTLDEVAAQFPGWRVWRGISGLLYGRKLLSSPPIVVRAEDAQDLIDQIRGEIGRRS